MLDEHAPGGPPPKVDVTNDNMNDTHNSIFFAAVATTRMPMIITDPRQPDNPIVFANPAFINMTGYKTDDLVGHNCRILQGPDTDRDVINQVRQAIRERREIAVEVLNYKKNGSSFWNALFVSPVFDAAGNLIYFFASQLDVTRRRDTEEALRQSQKMEAVGQLTGGIAHDFNNLLTVIQGFAELLQLALERNPINIDRSKRSIDAILKATDRGSNLTSQLLAFARKQKLQGRVVSVPDLVDDLLPLIKQSCGDDVDLTVTHRFKSGNTRIDPVQAELAIINIVVNARDAMDRRGQLSITTNQLSLNEDDPFFGPNEAGLYSCITITDTGSGMSPETLSHITEPFFTTKSEGKGTGLGMSMVYGFVKQSGALMKIESEVGKGTSVHMLFKCDTGQVEPPVIHAQSLVEGRKGERETILLVEDRADVAEFAETLLTDLGYTIIRAGSAEEALVQLKSSVDIELLFSDIVMPGAMNGVQLARDAVALRPGIKILLTTGYIDASIDAVDIHGVAFELINKPYHRIDLVKRIRMTIDGPDGVS